MANRNAPAGFLPVNHLSGSGWDGKTNRYYVDVSDTSAYAIGDLVSTVGGSGNGQVNGQAVDGVAQVVKTGSGMAPRGVLVGIEPVQGQDAVRVVPAAKTTGYFVLVADDPLLVCQVQCDNTTALAGTVVGQFASPLLAGAAGGLGVSGAQVASVTISPGNQQMLRVLGVAEGDLGANAQLLVSFNLHELGAGPAAGTVLVPVAASRTITAGDLRGELEVASGLTITWATDSALGITDPTGGKTSCGVAMYVAGAVAPTIVTTGLTIVGTAPTMAQYGWYALKRVGVNTWSWV